MSWPWRISRDVHFRYFAHAVRVRLLISPDQYLLVLGTVNDSFGTFPFSIAFTRATPELPALILFGLGALIWAGCKGQAQSCSTLFSRFRPVPTLMLVLAVVWSSTASATTVTTVSPRTVEIANPGATLDLLAYSQFTDANGKTVMNQTASDPVVAGATIKPTTTLVPVPKAGFSPVVGIQGVAKPATRRNVSSSFGGPTFSEAGRITYIPPADAMQPSKNGILDASAAHSIDRQGVGKGFSALRGVDPYMLPMGVYDSPVIIDLISFSVSPGDFGYASLFATDSRFMDPLWVLNVVAFGLTDSGNLSWDVSFSSNPLLHLNDTTIANQVTRDLRNSGGALTNYALFHTVYDVSVSSTVYGEGVEAIAGTAVPEPSTLMLITNGALFCLGIWYCRRGRPVA